MQSSATKRRSSSSPTLPSKRARPNPRVEQAEYQTQGLFESLAGWVMGRFNQPRQPEAPVVVRSTETRPLPLKPPPGGSLSLFASPNSRGNANSQPENVIVIDDDASAVADDGEAVRTQALSTQHALRHLNDLTRNPHFYLDQPLFRSKFNSPVSQASNVNLAAPAASFFPEAGPSRGPDTPGRPNVAFQSAARVYPWRRSSSSGSISSRSSESASSASKLRSRSSSNLRKPKATLKLLKSTLQNEDLDREKRGSMERVVRRMEQEGRGRRPPPRLDRANSDELSAALKGITLDRRQTIEEALAPQTQTYVPHIWKPRKRPEPAKLNVREFVSPIHQQDKRDEERLKKRLQPRIPKELSKEQAAIVETSLRNSRFSATIGTSGVVDARSLAFLKPNCWLNDDVVNFYAEMINARAKSSDQMVLCMNSYFYQKLSEDGYERANLKRWTKRMKVDIFALDQLLVPINIGNTHWVCAIINFSQQRIEYYDSMADHGHRRSVFENLRKYLQAEHKEKKGSAYSLDGWTDQYRSDTPRQDNGSDCGVFACQTLESAARGRDLVRESLEFTAANMPLFRRLMIVEIASSKLADRSWALK